MEKTKVLIAEDEVLISEELSGILEDFGFEVVGIADDYETAVKIIDSNPPDIAILDINMHGKEQGFDIATYLIKTLDVPFIFLSSYSDSKTLEKAGALLPNSYITKPFKKEQVFSALNIALASKKQRSIVIKDGTKSLKILKEDILWIKSDGNYIELKTKNVKRLIRSPLKSFVDSYQITELIQIHRCYAVNIQNVTHITTNFVEIGDEKLPLSRLYKDEIFEAFGKL